MKPQFRLLLPTVSALLLAQSAVTQAAVIYNSGLDGTTPSFIGTDNSQNPASIGGKAIGFQLGTSTALGVASYSLDSITVRLRNNEVTATSGYTFSLYSDNGGGTGDGTTRLGTSLADFTSVPITASADGNYTLNIASATTLNPSTIYWIVGRGTANLSWLGTGGTATTAAGITQTTPVAKFGTGSNPSTYASNSGIANDIQINATAVPEPSSALLLLGGIGVLAGFRRR